MTIQILTNVAQAYWGIIAVIIGFIVYAVFNWQNAKKIILGLMLQLEKEAETLALSTGDAKFQFVVDKGYQLLPQGARIFITPAMFTALAKSLYDEAKKYLVKYMPQPIATAPMIASVAIPASPTPTEASVVTPDPAPVAAPATAQTPAVGA